MRASLYIFMYITNLGVNNILQISATRSDDCTDDSRNVGNRIIDSSLIAIYNSVYIINKENSCIQNVFKLTIVELTKVNHTML